MHNTDDPNQSSEHYVLLCGGVGGAKVALGLSKVLPPEGLTILVNTGDDFIHAGLPVSPDVDTVLYTLAGLAHRAQGWGRADERWNAMDMVRALGAPDWFNLGDKDIGLCMARALELQNGRTFSEVTQRFAAALGIGCTVAPVTNDTVHTRVETAQGILSFQDYFVRHKTQPRFIGVQYDGAAEAMMSPPAQAAFARPDLKGIILANSNPWLSLGPALAIPQLRSAVAGRCVPCIGVSPIVGGQAVKGPLAKMMREMGRPVTPLAIAGYYDALLDVLLVDPGDWTDAFESEAQLQCSPISLIMKTLEDRIAVAKATMAAIDQHSQQMGAIRAAI